MSCNDEVGCKSQYLLYQSTIFSTGKGGNASSGEEDVGSLFSYMFFVSILVITAVSATLFGVFSFYCKNKQTLDDLQALEMTDFGGEGGGDGDIPSNIKVSSDISSYFSSLSGVVGGRSITSSGPDRGDGFFDHVKSGFISLGGMISSFSSSAPTSAGNFTALQTSSSHSDDMDDSAYDPPSIATGGQSLLGKISAYSPLSKEINYEEEDDDEITISL